MALLYVLIGFLAAILAAAPPGAANIVVVNTSTKETLTRAGHIIAGAGIGEVLISLLALHCTMNLTDFFKNNPWLQISIFIAFIAIGTYFLTKKPSDSNKVNTVFQKFRIPKFLKGVLLSLLNPPVLIFWVLAFTLLHQHVISVSKMSPFITLFLFFTGIFLGKTATLYSYGLWGQKVENSKNSSSRTIQTFIGIALILVGIIQGVRFFVT